MVSGHQHTEIEKALAGLPVRLVYNPDFVLGLGTSLKAGIAAVPAEADAAVVCLGAVVRGDTPHFDYVAGECARGIARVSLDESIPVIFGVLTTETVEQALNRAGLKAGNKGSDAAMTAIEMVNLLKQIS